MGKLMTLEQLLAIPKAETVTREVDLSAWGLGSVRIRQFSIRDNRRIREEATDENGEIDRARLEALTLAAGLIEPQITEAQADALLDTQQAPWEHVLNEMYELSGVTALLQMSQKAVNDAECRFRKRRG